MNAPNDRTDHGVRVEADAATVQRSNLFCFLHAHKMKDPTSCLLDRSRSGVVLGRDGQAVGIEFSTPYTKVLDDSDPAFPRWFVGGSSTSPTTRVQARARSRGDAPGDHLGGEDEGQRRLTYADLQRDVAMLADALHRLGVRKGDAVGIYLPMVPEVVVAFYAVRRSVRSRCRSSAGSPRKRSPQRLAHCQAKVVITADGTLRRGKQVSMKATVDQPSTRRRASST